MALNTYNVGLKLFFFNLFFFLSNVFIPCLPVGITYTNEPNRNWCLHHTKRFKPIISDAMRQRQCRGGWVKVERKCKNIQATVSLSPTLIWVSLYFPSTEPPHPVPHTHTYTMETNKASLGSEWAGNLYVYLQRITDKHGQHDSEGTHMSQCGR